MDTSTSVRTSLARCLARCPLVRLRPHPASSCRPCRVGHCSDSVKRNNKRTTIETTASTIGASAPPSTSAIAMAAWPNKDSSHKDSRRKCTHQAFKNLLSLMAPRQRPLLCVSLHILGPSSRRRPLAGPALAHGPLLPVPRPRCLSSPLWSPLIQLLLLSLPPAVAATVAPAKRCCLRQPRQTPPPPPPG